MGGIMEFIEEIDRKIQKKHLLNHPFYQAWSEGRLSKETLKSYALSYFPHVEAFPTYLSALHSHTEDRKVRKELLKNLMEEEGGTPNHPDLWATFAFSLGVTQEELYNQPPCPEIAHLITTFRKICLEGSVEEGLAALYAYESQIPPICISKIQGLKKYYNMQDPEAWRYFSVHIEADQEHAAVERGLLEHFLRGEVKERVHAAVDAVLDALWNFLSRYNKEYTCLEMG